MTTEEFNVLSLEFHFRGQHSDADQRVFEALSALNLVGYCGSGEVWEQTTLVSAELSIDEYEVPLTADAAGELSFTSLKPAELGEALLQASGAEAIYFDGDLVSGTGLGLEDDSIHGELPVGLTPQVIAGPRVPRSELALSAMGHGGGWRVREDAQGMLAVRTGAPVELTLNRKMVPALELTRHDAMYHIQLHARRGALNIEGSAAVEYWMPVGDRPVPAVAAGSPAAKLQQDLGLWLKGVDQDDLDQLAELWPEAVAPLQTLSAERDEHALRDFVQALGLPEEMVDLANGEPIPEEFEHLRAGLVTGLNLAVDEEIDSARGVMKLVYRTGWSPTALISSSLGVLVAGYAANRWMKSIGKPGTGWRRTIMFFWYSDAIYYLARGIRDVLGKRIKG
ncbi:hypothetical protein [Glutamicibacter uratoxydans]|uniref:hypothetical protein n=1 Tax=Glutamicibacter uratoxydans TaxID=43667 RepID=UPI003D6E0F62